MIPKFITVELPEAIEITTDTGNTSAFKVDPTAAAVTRGAPRPATSPSRSPVSHRPVDEVVNVEGDDTADPDPTGWLNAVHVHQPGCQPGRRGRLVHAAHTAQPQVPDFATNCPDGAFAGCEFTDFTELEVFGEPS